jgi:dihydrofolate synthase/folylpolyglutamate synthase
MTTALAFAYFSNQKVDIAIIETGLGGRLDATNIIKPELSVITNVALDHQDLLGDTIGLIAKEKAGIIKEGIPVVLGLTSDEVVSIVAKIADQRQSKFSQSTSNKVYKSALAGDCQQENIATVCAVVKQLRLLGWNITEESLNQGLQNVIVNTQLRGRWEQISDAPRVICDTGHNIHAVKSIVKQLDSECYDNLWIVLGLVGDKDVDGILELLPIDANYVFCQADIPRALSVDKLFDKAVQYSLGGIKVQNPVDALAEAQKLANENDLIFVGGSTFVVAEIL